MHKIIIVPALSWPNWGVLIGKAIKIQSVHGHDRDGLGSHRRTSSLALD